MSKSYRTNSITVLGLQLGQTTAKGQPGQNFSLNNQMPLDVVNWAKEISVIFHLFIISHKNEVFLFCPMVKQQSIAIAE